VLNTLASVRADLSPLGKDASGNRGNAQQLEVPRPVLPLQIGDVLGVLLG
jgi:hypothetical protein